MPLHQSRRHLPAAKKNNHLSDPSIVTYGSNLGFTLVEILISVVIASLFFTLVGRTMANMITSRNRVNTNVTIQKLVDQTLLSLTQEARWAETFSNTANSITFSTDTQNISYTLTDTNLVKTTAQIVGNPFQTSENLNPPGYQITQFAITNRSPDPDRPSYEIILTITNTPSQPGATTLTYTNRTALSIRNLFPGIEL